MKIIVITPNYPPTICGVGDHSFHLVQSLLKQGIAVDVICSATQTAAQSRGETIYPVLKRWDTEGVQLVQKLIADIQPDWVIVQMIAYGYEKRGLPFNVLSFYAHLKQAHIKVLTVFHEVRIRPEGDIRKWVVGRLQTYIARQMAKMSTKIVTSIDFYADILRGGQKDLPINIIPIGSGIAPVPVSEAAKQLLKRRHNIPINAPVIVTFGNRNIEIYLKAFDQLAQDYPNFIWLLCGKTGASVAVIKSRSYIRHTGEMSASDIYQALSLGDAAFLPEPVNQKMEGGSSNKSTALACVLSLGIPVVGVKGDMNNTLLKHENNILLVDIHQPNTLYESLKYCLSTEGAKKMGQEAKELYQTALSWNVLSKQFLTLMDIEPNNQHKPLLKEVESSNK